MNRNMVFLKKSFINLNTNFSNCFIKIFPCNINITNFLRTLVLFALLIPFIVNAQQVKTEAVYVGDVEKGKQVAGQICAACHAADGNSVIPTNPILAGQHSAYIEKQLHNFQVKNDNKKAMRENAVMLGFASALDDKQISDLAAFYSKQIISPSYAKDEDLALAGETLYRAGDLKNGVPACGSCHGPKGSGIPDQYPRISGQHAEYTKATLLAFKKGMRANNSQMMTISSRMSDEQISAVSEYLAGLR